MSQRTESSSSDERPEFSTEYLLSLAGAAAFVLILVFVLTPMVGNPLKIGGTMPWLFGWVLAGGQTIANGLSDFSGESPGLVDRSFLSAALVSMLLVGVLAPTLTLLLMRSRSQEAVPLGSRGLYLVGLVISVTFALTVLPTGFITASVSSRLREAQAVQTNKDLMINDLNMVAMRVREYRILPKRLGGGEGSTDGFVPPASLAATEEGTYSVTAAGKGAMVEATSKKHTGARIAVKIYEDGALRDWTYSGRFE